MFKNNCEWTVLHFMSIIQHDLRKKMAQGEIGHKARIRTRNGKMHNVIPTYFIHNGRKNQTGLP